ncbi:GNAT family N-acetyltransferase [Mesorhizobium sp.]|uniref:GNAT family N-acetyltransferase n=1 Tax=Mesorhizobium sp. TaxID=1871066 RepID=UPI000FE53936|nr:GNAT family N-acetyltransferase [Mesorhizobium sp.]RWK41932.1 MAG: GNAT family N-acetyltransferase [Mesorhizobium sp.]RWK66708.1 MAG: GNAT family N-acetyltransferase [Mesorhizobium sp.]RWK75350.1 MAG: GNAT family N-acetyltransferase [Mesorhizobium sp.]RWK78047.1 MAG: GNAT family N-acetyltransferase [Mesorhizobium sp.]RWL02558.1 MAG: GNAT family N-acetyltransferase [Mesorhizobium sp.]
MQPTIGPMHESDFEMVARLRLAAFFEGTGRALMEDTAGLRKLLAGDGFEVSLVARIGGVPVGTCLLVRHELEPAHDLTPWLAGLAVVPEHQRCGIGRALVRAIEAHAASAGVSELYLYTWEARDFYATLGWNAVEAFEQDGGTLLLMSRRLSR